MMRCAASYLIIAIVMMTIHIRAVEEKELIERFGDSYIEYRKKVPALFVRPKKIGVYLKFLAGRL